MQPKEIKSVQKWPPELWRKMYKLRRFTKLIGEEMVAELWQCIWKELDALFPTSIRWNNFVKSYNGQKRLNFWSLVAVPPDRLAPTLHRKGEKLPLTKKT